MLRDNSKETPALENLFNEEDAEKVESLMTEVYTSKDKLEFVKRLFKDKDVLFENVDKPAVLKAMIGKNIGDPAVVKLVNLKKGSKGGNTALHEAVKMMSYQSTSILLKAGNFKFILNEDDFTPALENLFQEEKVSEIDQNLVRGLLMKTKNKLLSPERTLDCLKIVRADGCSILSLVESSQWEEAAAIEGIGDKIAQFAPNMGADFAEWLVLKTREEDWDEMKAYKGLTEINKVGKTAVSVLGIQQWSEVSMWKTSKKGLFFRIDNTELKDTIQAWSRTLVDSGDGEENKAAVVRESIQEKGAVVKLLVNSSSNADLRTAVERWNEKNKDFCEYRLYGRQCHHLHILVIVYYKHMAAALRGSQHSSQNQIQNHETSRLVCSMTMEQQKNLES